MLFSWTSSHPRSRRRRLTDGPPVPAEVLELRALRDVTLAQLSPIDLPAGKFQYLPLTAVDTGDAAVTFDVTSSNSNVQATILTGGRSLKLNVTGKDSANQTFTGDIVIRLFEDAAPATTARLIELAEDGFYDDLTFHRILDGFVAQGGDPDGDGTGGSGVETSDEFDPQFTFTSNGLLAMANSGSDTQDSQFFITDVDLTLAQQPQHLNFKHSIIGVMTSGIDVFRKLIGTPVSGSSGSPVSKPVINSATVFTDTQNGVLRVTSSSASATSSVTVTARGGGSATAVRTANINVVTDTTNDKPFLGTVNNATTPVGQPVTIVVPATDLEGDSLTYVVRDANNFAGLTNATANITVEQGTGADDPSVATIVITPTAGFNGTLNLVLGVRDGTNRSFTGEPLDAKSNFDTQAFTLTVGTPVNQAPTATAATVRTAQDASVEITLTGADGDAGSVQVLTFEIVTQPENGTISNFDPATGKLRYTPDAGFSGNDPFTFRVKDNGGTANGGVDTSPAATLTVEVGGTPPAPPTAFALSAASDDGLLNNDRVVSGRTLTVTANALQASTVTFKLNGGAPVTATETSAGVYSVTFTDAPMQVGENSVVATVTDDGLASTESTPFTFTFAPSFDTLYTVPGAIGSAQTLNVRFAARQSAFQNEIGFFVVDEADGTINNIAPGAPGYAAAAMNSTTRRVLFARDQAAGATTTITTTGGALIAFYLIRNDTTANFIANNVENDDDGSTHAFFTFSAANPGGVRHTQVIADPLNAQVQIGFEDFLMGGDRDYNDAVLELSPSTITGGTVTEAHRVPTGTGQDVELTATLKPAERAVDGSTTPAATTAGGEFGVFVVDSGTGAIGGVAPTASGYVQAALNSSTRKVLFNQGDALNTEKSVTVPGGALLAYYYIPGGTAADVLDENPTNDEAGEPFAFFSFDAANPDDVEHFRWFAPERRNTVGTSSTGALPLQLHVMDVLNGTTQDFDAFLIELELAAP